jgi:hypothetical protein
MLPYRKEKSLHTSFVENTLSLMTPVTGETLLLDLNIRLTSNPETLECLI